MNIRRCTAESYLRHPNSYLPKYNIQSETDGESIPLTQSIDAMVGINGSNRIGQQRILLKNGVDIGPHQIVQSDEDDEVPAYGFPSQKRRNRIEQKDMDLNNGGKLTYTLIENSTQQHPLISSAKDEKCSVQKRNNQYNAFSQNDLLLTTILFFFPPSSFFTCTCTLFR